jgi:hypothetical protein
MGQSNAATLVCEQPCEFAYRDGVFIVTDPSLGFDRAIPVATFLRNFENSAIAINAYLASESVPASSAKIIPFRKRA